MLKRPKKRLLKADPERRAVFVREYALPRAAAATSGAKIFFADEAHFYADVDLRGTWVLKGEPALVGSTSPRCGEKASYYAAVCLETGEVEAMEVDGNSCAETPGAFLQQLRTNHAEPLIVIWDNGPAHGGDAIRAYLTTPDLRVRLVRLPAYSPDLNPDEAIGGWIREEVTANTCFGTKAKVHQHVGRFFRDIAQRTDEVSRRCRRTLQSLADGLAPTVNAILQQPKAAEACRSHRGFGLGKGDDDDERRALLRKSVLTMAELHRLYDGEVDWLVEGYIGRREITEIAAPRESLKSWATADLARAVLTGTKWLDYFDVTKGNVVYIEGERANNLVYQTTLLERAYDQRLGDLIVIPPGKFFLRDRDSLVVRHTSIDEFSRRQPESMSAGRASMTLTGDAVGMI